MPQNICRLIDGGKEESFAGRLSRAEDEGDKAAFSIRQDWTDTGENAEREEADKEKIPHSIEQGIWDHAMYGG